MTTTLCLRDDERRGDQGERGQREEGAHCGGGDEVRVPRAVRHFEILDAILFLAWLSEYVA